MPIRLWVDYAPPLSWRQTLNLLPRPGLGDSEQIVPIKIMAKFKHQCAICIVLHEHLEILPVIFDEIVRVAGRYIFISLPDYCRDAQRPIAKGTGAFAHYGLPVYPPMDRHK
jgi:hypothetical protein